VKNAFLHGDLTEDIYMRPPAGLFSTPTSAVCKLRCSLYGLKQAPHAWYERFTSILFQFDFLRSKYDASLFLRKTAHGIVFLLVYVDDIVITKVVNSVSVGVLFFQLEWNVSVSECFGVPFRGCTVHIYIYIYIYI
jgi:hypothetical protein